EVDRSRGTGGVSLRWKVARIVVPRSNQAKSTHGRMAEVAIAPSAYSRDQRKTAAQLKTMERSHVSRQAERKQQCDLEVQVEEASQTADTAARTKGFSDRVNVANSLIAQLKKEEQEATASEAKQMEMRLARIDANHAPTLKAAQSKRTAIQKKIAGVSGVVKIEIP